MSKLKITVILLVLMSILLIVPTAFAQDNQTSLGMDSNASEVLTADYYFDVSLENDTGNGSEINPYKELSASKIADNSVIHLANGEYTLNESKTVNNVTIIGQDRISTVIKGSDLRVGTSFTLINVTFTSTITNNGNFNSVNSEINTLRNYNVSQSLDSKINSTYNYASMSTTTCQLERIQNSGDYLSNCDVFNQKSMTNNRNVTVIGGLFTSYVITNNAKLNLTGSVLNRSRISNSGELYALNSIFANSSSAQGGAIKSSKKIVLKNTTFVNNTADYGGAIFVDTDSVIQITDSVFENNYAKLFGGAISIYEGSNITVKNSRFVNDYSLGDAGGAIYIKKSPKAVIANSSFEKCNATFGAAITSLNSSLDITSLTARSNTAKYDGGAIYLIYNVASIVNSTFDKNSANNGGALYVDGVEQFTIKNNTFTDNRANRTGGAIYSLFSDTFYGSILNNTLNNSFSKNNASYENDVYESNSLNLEIGNGNYILIKYSPLFNGTLPSSFDLRDYNYVTPVKNQGSGGNCWSFSATAALESCILKATGNAYDLSEENMKNLMALYSDYGWAMETNAGGYEDMGVGYLASWLGPVNESDDIYSEYSALSPVLDSFIHVQNIIFLNRANYTDNDAIKRAIMDYGAVSTSLYWNSAYASGKNYYYTGKDGANHAVTIVGWDDNYSKNNFRSTPPGDGAWIFKNSWGTNSGDKGFYYVSYYDTKFAPVNKSKSIYTIIFNETIRFDKNYQYDISGRSDYLLNKTDTVWYKNRFVSGDNEYLAAVSTYFQKETQWNLSIYVNDVLKHTQSGFATSSYRTINLDKLIPLNVGDIFEVVFKIKVNGDVGVPVSEAVSFNHELYSQGTSFISSDGQNWIDLYGMEWSYPDHTYTSQVASIKAFTVLNKINTTLSLSVQDNTNPMIITAIVTDQYGNNLTSGSVEFSFDGIKKSVDVKNGIATIIHTFASLKNNVIKASFKADGYEDSSSQITVSEILKTTLKSDDIITYFGDEFEYAAVLTDSNGNPVSLKEIKFIANGNEFVKKTDAEGKATIKLNLDIGNYEVEVMLIDESQKLTNHITVLSTIILPDQSAYAYNSAYTVTLYGSDGNLLKNSNVTLIVDDVEYELTTDSKGLLSYNIKLNPGTHKIEVFNLNNFEIKSQSVKVVSRITKNAALTMYYGAGKYYKVRVCDDDGKFTKGLKVTFNVNGKTYTRLTDENGYASLKISLKVGKYTIKASYKGYSVSNKITVKTTLVTKDKTVKKGKTLKFTVKLLDKNGKILKNKKITIKFKGKTYKVKTNSKGIATLKIKMKYKAGSYTIKSTYGSLSVKNKIKIKK